MAIEKPTNLTKKIFYDKGFSAFQKLFFVKNAFERSKIDAEEPIGESNYYDYSDIEKIVCNNLFRKNFNLNPDSVEAQNSENSLVFIDLNEYLKLTPNERHEFKNKFNLNNSHFVCSYIIDINNKSDEFNAELIKNKDNINKIVNLTEELGNGPKSARFIVRNGFHFMGVVVDYEAKTFAIYDGMTGNSIEKHAIYYNFANLRESFENKGFNLKVVNGYQNDGNNCGPYLTEVVTSNNHKLETEDLKKISPKEDLREKHKVFVNINSTYVCSKNLEFVLDINFVVPNKLKKPNVSKEYYKSQTDEKIIFLSKVRFNYKNKLNGKVIEDSQDFTISEDEIAEINKNKSNYLQIFAEKFNDEYVLFLKNNKGEKNDNTDYSQFRFINSEMFDLDINGNILFNPPKEKIYELSGFLKSIEELSITDDIPVDKTKDLRAQVLLNEFYENPDLDEKSEKSNSEKIKEQSEENKKTIEPTYNKSIENANLDEESEKSNSEKTKEQSEENKKPIEPTYKKNELKKKNAFNGAFLGIAIVGIIISAVFTGLGFLPIALPFLIASLALGGVIAGKTVVDNKKANNIKPKGKEAEKPVEHEKKNIAIEHELEHGRDKDYWKNKGKQDKNNNKNKGKKR